MHYLAYYALKITCKDLCQSWTHHDREDDGSHSGLEDPKQSQAQQLDKSEKVNFAQWHMPQVDQVWLVLGRH